MHLLLLITPDHPVFWVLPVGALGLLAFVLSRAGGALSPTAVRDTPPTLFELPEEERPVPTVIINPSKFTNETETRALITQECRAHGWQAPVFIETTEEEGGRSQARAALGNGAKLVLACGGDGTVRQVAQELAGSGVPLGLLPAGTGNLLARNLDLPLDDLASAVRVALTGRSRQVDIGWASLDGEPEQAFLVMAGMGFDGEIMANAPEALKDKAGATAYVVAGVQRLNGPRTRVRIDVDGKVQSRRVRSVIIGNCGKLQAGIELIPGAKPDDGKLDVVALSPRGVVGWGAVAVAVLSKRHRGHPLVERVEGTAVDAWSERPLTAQVDGDPLGHGVRLRARVEPQALVVKVGTASATG